MEADTGELPLADRLDKRRTSGAAVARQSGPGNSADRGPDGRDVPTPQTACVGGGDPSGSTGQGRDRSANVRGAGAERPGPDTRGRRGCGRFAPHAATGRAHQLGRFPAACVRRIAKDSSLFDMWPPEIVPELTPTSSGRHERVVSSA